MVTGMDRRTLLRAGGALVATLLAGHNLSAIARDAAVQRETQQFTALSPGLAATLDAMFRLFARFPMLCEFCFG